MNTKSSGSLWLESLAHYQRNMQSVLEKIIFEQEMLNEKTSNFNIEIREKQKAVFEQYINQYIPTIKFTLENLRQFKEKVQVPYAQFLFSISEYFGLLYTVAHYGIFDKKAPDNFTNFLKSQYFPTTDHCKARLVWFIRNGVMHQIFPKATAIGISCKESLFFKNNDNTPILNLEYYDRKIQEAIAAFVDDLNLKTEYLNNTHRLLILEHYGFDDHIEFDNEINKSFEGQLEKVFSNCTP